MSAGENYSCYITWRSSINHNGGKLLLTKSKNWCLLRDENMDADKLYISFYISWSKSLI